MKLRARKMLVLVGCALVASSAYACGIELEGTGGAADAGPTSSSGGSGPGASTSSGASGTSGGPGSTTSSGGSTSGGTSGTSTSSGDVGDAAPDAPGGTCTTTTIPGALTGCLPVAGFTNGTFEGRPTSCARGGVVPALILPDVLAANTTAQEGAFWHQIALPMAGSFTVEAVLKVTGTSAASTGAGFSIALVNRNADAATALPTTGQSATNYGIRRLVDFPGVTAMVRAYTQLKLVPSAVPNLSYDPDVGPSDGIPAAEDRYTLVVRHEAGAANLTSILTRSSDPTVIGPVTIPLAGTAIETGSAFVGVTAATGNSYTAEHQLLSLTITRCDP